MRLHGLDLFLLFSLGACGDSVDTGAGDPGDPGDPGAEGRELSEPRPAGGPAVDSGAPSPVETDADGDGYDAVEYGGEDCDDSDPGHYPAAVATFEGMDLAYLCPGTFTMGSPTTEIGRDSDETEHQVTLTRPFWIGVTEVTQSQFAEFMGYQPSLYEGCPSCPVEQVTWFEAAAFTNALSDRAGLAPCYTCSGSESDVECELAGDWESPYHCPGYRLPTEAEWEYAARAGTTTAFSNGGGLASEADESNCAGMLVLDNGEVLDHIGWYCGNDDHVTHPVGSLQPNPWGLYDVHGNVYEWVQDRYDEYAGDATDPWGTEDSLRVKRGGSWKYFSPSLRSANRYGYGPGFCYDGLGFRVARTD